MWKCKGGCWSGVGPFSCRHGGSGATSSGIVTKSWRGVSRTRSAGGEQRALLLRDDHEPSWITRQMDNYERAQARGTAAAKIIDAYRAMRAQGALPPPPFRRYGYWGVLD